MSARRRQGRNALLERSARLRKRRGLACRAYHWREMWHAATTEPWRRPFDQDVEVAFYGTRCRRCRIGLDATAVITRAEYVKARDETTLRAEKLLAARSALWRGVAPFGVRRQEARRAKFWLHGHDKFAVRRAVFQANTEVVMRALVRRERKMP